MSFKREEEEKKKNDVLEETFSLHALQGEAKERRQILMKKRAILWSVVLVLVLSLGWGH